MSALQRVFVASVLAGTQGHAQAHADRNAQSGAVAAGDNMRELGGLNVQLQQGIHGEGTHDARQECQVAQLLCPVSLPPSHGAQCGACRVEA